MLAALGNRKANSRKRRLFACACYRHATSLLFEKRCMNAVMVSEQYVDGKASTEELSKALNEASALFPRRWPSSLPTAYYAEEARAVAAHASQNGVAERLYQARILRCLFGNPFRPVRINPEWLTPTVLSLAQAAYDHRSLPSGTLENERLAILADVLQDADCDNPDILNHLRQQQSQHVRGCWVIDLLLGKE